MKIVAPSPHIHSGDNTKRLMRDVVIALTPAFAFSVFLFGVDAFITTAVAIISCVVFEWAISRFMLRRQSSIGDYSAILTGMLLGFNLPPSINWMIVPIGSLVAIGVAKMSFGGLGRNLFNPALVGRVFLLISFPVAMTTFPVVDSVSGATPLSLLKQGGVNAMPSIETMILGLHGGSVGEVAAFLLILGGGYLLVRKVITWHIPVAILGSIGLFSLIPYLIDSTHYASPIFHILAGGSMLGAFFMATDYVTSPMSVRGMIVYGVGIGVLTMLIRMWGSYPEGISFAILILNSVVPLINNTFKPKRFARQ